MMQGVSIITNPDGQPTVLTIDLRTLPETALKGLVKELFEAIKAEEETDQFLEAAASDSLKEMWATPEEDTWDGVFEQWKKKKDGAAAV